MILEKMECEQMKMLLHKTFFSRAILFFGGGTLGFAVYFYMYGVAFLDISYDAWILDVTDCAQHYLGWCFFRDSPWTFPFGLTQGYAYPAFVSVMYADAIPFFAVFFKIFSPFLPSTFQYIGLYGCLSFVLQGGIGAILLRRFLPRNDLSIVFSLFFSVSFPIIVRTYGHTALASQWILLLALCVLFYNDEFRKDRFFCLAWLLLASLCVWIHGYFVPMVFIIMLCSVYIRYWKNRKYGQCVLLPSLFVLVVLGNMFFLGSFSSNVALGNAGLGFFSSNLNTFFRPFWPAFFPVFPTVNAQAEGECYLGIGCILMFIFSLGILAYRKFALRECGDGTGYQPVMLMCILFCALAVFPWVYLNDYEIIKIQYPYFLEKLLSLFRANGRFIWTASYLIVLFSIVMGFRGWRSQKKGAIFVSVMLVLNVYDFFGIMQVIHDNPVVWRVAEEERGLLSHYDEFEKILPRYDKLVYTDYRYTLGTTGHKSIVLSYYAYKAGTKITALYLARMPEEKLQKAQEQYIADLTDGMPEEDTLYILSDEKEMELYHNLHYYTIGDILVGSKKEIADMQPMHVNHSYAVEGIQ